MGFTGGGKTLRIGAISPPWNLRRAHLVELLLLFLKDCVCLVVETPGPFSKNTHRKSTPGKNLPPKLGMTQKDIWKHHLDFQSETFLVRKSWHPKKGEDLRFVGCTKNKQNHWKSLASISYRLVATSFTIILVGVKIIIQKEPPLSPFF